MKYKVILFKKNYTVTNYFTNYEDASFFAKNMNGIILNAKGGR